MKGMSKVLKAKYDAAQNALRLVEPLEGVPNEADVEVTVTAPDAHESSILDYRGCLSGENGEEFAAIIDAMYPIEK
jgi:hypothetical protein